MSSSSSAEKLMKKIADLEAKRGRAETERDHARSIGDKEAAKACSLEIIGLDNRLRGFEEEARQARPATPSHTSGGVVENLRKLGINFSSRDIRFLMNNDPIRFNCLKAPDLQQEEALSYITFARSRIKSATQRQIGMHEDLMLDGSFSYGQAQSSIYYAFTESGGVLAAKTFYRNEDSYHREVAARQAIGKHDNLVNFIKSFSLPDSEKRVIVMDFFPKSVFELLQQYDNAKLPFPNASLRTIIQGCGSALEYIHSQGYCFGDVKPANIMLDRGENGKAVLVDFGAVVPLGSAVTELSNIYCLDLEVSIGSRMLDWICLSSSVAQMIGIDISRFNKRSLLLEQILGTETLSLPIKQFLCTILDAKSSLELIHQLFIKI